MEEEYHNVTEAGFIGELTLEKVEFWKAKVWQPYWSTSCKLVGVTGQVVDTAVPCLQR